MRLEEKYDVVRGRREGRQAGEFSMCEEEQLPVERKYVHPSGLIGALDKSPVAHENGCPWGYQIWSAAAAGGHLETLQYAHEN